MLVKSILVVLGITAGTAAGYGVLAKAAPDAAAPIEGLLRDIGLGWDEASCQANPRACLTSRYEQLEALERQVGTSTGAIRAELDRVSRLVSDQEELVARNALFLEQGRDLYRKRDAEGAAAADAPIRFAGRTYPNRATFRAQANVQVHWNGVLRIDAQGQHAFVLELSKAEGFGIGNCRGVLRLNDQIVIDNGINFRFRGPNVQSSLIQGARNLAPGAYDFSLFVTCVRDNNDAFGLVTASLAMAGPGDRVPRPIAADRLGVRE